MYKKILVVLGLMVSGTVSAIHKNEIEKALRASVQYGDLVNNPFVDVYDCMFVACGAIERMMEDPLKCQKMLELLELSQQGTLVKKRRCAGAVEAAEKMLRFALELKKAR